MTDKTYMLGHLITLYRITIRETFRAGPGPPERAIAGEKAPENAGRIAPLVISLREM